MSRANSGSADPSVRLLGPLREETKEVRSSILPGKETATSLGYQTPVGTGPLPRKAMTEELIPEGLKGTGDKQGRLDGSLGMAGSNDTIVGSSGTFRRQSFSPPHPTIHQRGPWTVVAAISGDLWEPKCQTQRDPQTDTASQAHSWVVQAQGQGPKGPATVAIPQRAPHPVPPHACTSKGKLNSSVFVN